MNIVDPTTLCPEVSEIELNDLVGQQWGVHSSHDMYFSGDVHLSKIWRREGILLRWLPARLVRRLDRGFARSNPVHPDTARVLYSVCRAMKPDCVFETGTYWGYSTAYLAAAVRDNGCGSVWTFDVYSKAGRYIPASLKPYVHLKLGRPSIESMPEVLAEHVPQLFFQDSVHDYAGVAGELKMLSPFLKSGSTIVFHDFVAPDVRRAAFDVLKGCVIRRIKSSDPQQIGIAIQT